MQEKLTIPTEVIAVTVLMIVGMGLNLPAFERKKKHVNNHNELTET